MYAEKYQWIKGDKSGNVEQYLSHDNEWVYFVGGNRISSEIMPEYMLQVDANTPLDFSITKPINKVQRVNVREETKKEEINPVKSLLKRASKQSIACTYNFDINIPKQSVYNLVQDSFDAEVDSIILELVMSDINREELYKNIENQIKNHILKFYNDGHGSTDTAARQPRSKEEPSTMGEQSPAQELS